VGNIRVVQEELAKGLYVDNLYEMARECMRIAEEAKDPLAFYVLAHVFGDIARDWDERPLPAVEVEEMELRIGSPLRRVITAIERDHEPAQLHDGLNSLVWALLVAPEDLPTGT
jgi:hypothetical protein